MQNNICTQCGYKNNKSANFCKSCGTPLEDIEKSAEQKAEEVKQKLRETAQDVKQTSKDSVSTLFILMKPVFKAKVIVPIIVVILSVVFWDNMVNAYDDYKYEQKVVKEKKAKEERLAKEKKAKEERIVREKKTQEEWLVKRKKEKEERFANIAKQFDFNSHSEVDNSTKIIWQDNSDAKNIKKNWSGAKEYCQSLIIEGYNDWRLPNKDLLEALYTKKNNLNNISSNYWSSSTRANQTSQASYVNFYDGHTYYYGKTHSLYVRCVRGGQ